MLDFLNFLIDLDKVECVRDEWMQLSRLRALVNMMPSTVSILCGLDLEEYKQCGAHDDAILAEKLGMRSMEVHIAIEQMVAVGMIELENGIYQQVSESLDLFLSVPDLWERLGVQAELSGLFAGSVSEETLITIRSRMESFLLECQTIAEADEHKTRAIILSIQMGRLDRAL